MSFLSPLHPPRIRVCFDHKSDFFPLVNVLFNIKNIDGCTTERISLRIARNWFPNYNKNKCWHRLGDRILMGRTHTRSHVRIRPYVCAISWEFGDKWSGMIEIELRKPDAILYIHDRKKVIQIFDIRDNDNARCLNVRSYYYYFFIF